MAVLAFGFIFAGVFMAILLIGINGIGTGELAMKLYVNGLYVWVMMGILFSGCILASHYFGLTGIIS